VLLFKFYSGIWLSYLSDLLSLRVGGVVGARLKTGDYTHSASVAWIRTQGFSIVNPVLTTDLSRHPFLTITTVGI